MRGGMRKFRFPKRKWPEKSLERELRKRAELEEAESCFHSAPAECEPARERQKGYWTEERKRTTIKLHSSRPKSNGNITPTDLTFGPQTSFSLLATTYFGNSVRK